MIKIKIKVKENVLYKKHYNEIRGIQGLTENKNQPQGNTNQKNVSYF